MISDFCMEHTIEHKVAPAPLLQSRMACALALKSVDAQGVFAGYASVFHNVDAQRDVIVPGAFRHTIDGRAAQIKLLWQHDMREPIGVVEALHEDANGLYVKGQLLLDVARAREAYALLRAGVVSGLSIGYSPRQWKMDEQQGVRRLLALDLWEISLVTFPANDAARITVVKQAQEAPSGDDARWQQAQRAGQVMRLAAALEQARRSLLHLAAR